MAPPPTGSTSTGGTFTGDTTASSITFNFNNLGVTPGTYDLINYNGATGTNLATNEFTATGVAGTFALNGTELDFITTVPEPATFLGGALLVDALGWHQRRRVRGWFAVRRSQARAENGAEVFKAGAKARVD